jgi:hypothetical protein
VAAPVIPNDIARLAGGDAKTRHWYKDEKRGILPRITGRGQPSVDGGASAPGAEPPIGKESSVIYEIRTYQIAPGSLAEVEKRFGEGYEYRKKHSELTAFWHTEIGPLNEIIHVWGYSDLAERAKIRAGAAKETNWPPKIGEFVRAMRSEIIVPFGFVPTPTPGKMGPFFEIRYYTLKPGMLPETAKGWEAKLPDRMKMSPVVLAGGV